MGFQFVDKKETKEAYKILKYMEAAELTISEAKETADLLVEMLKENRTLLLKETKHGVLFELSDVTLHH